MTDTLETVETHEVVIPLDPQLSYYQLVALGGTPGTVAASLAELGIKGRMGSGCNCPIARYLQSEGYEYAVVSARTYSTDRGRFDTGEIVPWAIGAFIKKFDAGTYPDLVEESND